MKASDAQRLAGSGPVAVDEAHNICGEPSGAGVRIGLVCARFNGAVTELLLAGAVAELDACGVDRSSLTVAWVPGAFELPLASMRLAASGTVDAVVCLGAVIRGETSHYDFVAGECAAGLREVQLATGVPVVFGVLTTEDADQAFARATAGGEEGPRRARGADAARTAVEMADLLRRLPPASHVPDAGARHANEGT
ncbi:MAG: 6,7-dimethyl-8-ribityllumazine synthase [Actinomycetota bacterium]|nr:6,7-dimethyl-8-ribityllumazine synthase [Actinomycetota bacterium]